MDIAYYKHLIQECKKYKQIIIYGAHLIAREVYSCIQRDGKINIIGFAVTNRYDNPKDIEGIPVKIINEYAKYKNEAFILIAAPEKYEVSIINILKNIGFENYASIGIKGITLLLGDYIEKNNTLYKTEYIISKSKHDYTWLNLNISDGRNEYYKFPIMSHFPIPMRISALKELDISSEYKRMFGIYLNVTGELGQESDNSFNDWSIYMVMSHRDKGKASYKKTLNLIKTIQAGCALTDNRLDAISDDVGDNISEKNRCLCEMTAAYWVWKNSKPSNFKGMCHYRRHFVLNNDSFARIKDGNIDVILPIPRVVTNGIRNMYIEDTPVKESAFENLFTSIESIYGTDVLNLAKEYFESHIYFPNNMLIAKEEIFNDYCNWIFQILLKMYDNEKKMGVDMDDRHIAYASEIITSLYFHLNKSRYNIAVAEYDFWGG